MLLLQSVESYSFLSGIQRVIQLIKYKCIEVTTGLSYEGLHSVVLG